MAAAPASAETEKTGVSKAGVRFRVVTVAKGLSNPWGLTFLPGGDMLVTERPGRLRLIRQGKLEADPISGVPAVAARGQGGLLDVALHPKFAENRLIYLSFAMGPEGEAGTEVMRAKLNADRLEEGKTIFRASPKTRGDGHYGSRILFLPDGTMLVTVGDRYLFRDEAQNLKTHLGKIVRLKDDGTVPPDNPFVGKEGALPRIYSYGHRNMQGLALRPGTSQVWEHEHGPRGGDEVNIIKPGANYGWPKATYGIDYSGEKISDNQTLPGMENPVVYWVPSIAPSGMAFYAGDKFPQWKGDLFVGALAEGTLRRLKLNGDKVADQEKLGAEEIDARVRDVRSGTDGFLYVLTDDDEDGKVLRLEPAG